MTVFVVKIRDYNVDILYLSHSEWRDIQTLISDHLWMNCRQRILKRLLVSNNQIKNIKTHPNFTKVKIQYISFGYPTWMHRVFGHVTVLLSTLLLIFYVCISVWFEVSIKLSKQSSLLTMTSMYGIPLWVTHIILKNTRPNTSTTVESSALYVGILLSLLMKSISSPGGYSFEGWKYRDFSVWKNVLLTYISAVVEFLCKMFSSGKEYGQDNVHDHSLLLLCPG
jgi:hypothetical protein